MANIKKKIKNLTDLEQIDGQLHEDKIVPSRMDMLFGETGLGRYNTLNKAEYISRLENFNIAELRNHAIKVGLIPTTNVTRLKKQLLTEFDKYTLAFNSPPRRESRNLAKEKADLGLSIMSAVK